MSNYDEQIKQLIQFDPNAFPQVREFYQSSADAFEKLTRHNQAIFGDIMDFAVQQTKLPLETDNAADLMARQVDASLALNQKMTERFQTFMDIARDAQAHATEVVTAEIKKEVKKAA